MRGLMPERLRDRRDGRTVSDDRLAQRHANVVGERPLTRRLARPPARAPARGSRGAGRCDGPSAARATSSSNTSRSCGASKRSSQRKCLPQHRLVRPAPVELETPRLHGLLGAALREVRDAGEDDVGQHRRAAAPSASSQSKRRRASPRRRRSIEIRSGHTSRL